MFKGAVGTALLLILARLASSQTVLVHGHPVHPTRLLARWAAGMQIEAQSRALRAHGLAARPRRPFAERWVTLEPQGPQGTAAVKAAGPEEQARQLVTRIEVLRASGQFEFVEPDYLLTVTSMPADAGLADGRLWGLRNFGQSGGVSGADIGAEPAWEFTTGSTNVIVAVIDTGIRSTHRDLAAQMWRNPREIPGNKIDDDGNGYVDDVFGINAITGSGNPADDNDHGTHVAGTIGAAANNGYPHVGVAWQVRLMACKFLGADGYGYTSDAVECIRYAVQNGARVLNNSWGGGSYSQALYEAILAAREVGVLFVAAAGNYGESIDFLPHYPSSYVLDNVVAVAAIDRQDRLADFSNYGRQSVHLGAPGVNIFSSIAHSDTAYDFFSGTSMAAPHVSGAAALLLARFPGLSGPELRQFLLAGTVQTPPLSDMTVSGGRLHAGNSLRQATDRVLSLALSPTPGQVLIAGEVVRLCVSVTDLGTVTNAKVTGSMVGHASLQFRNDGIPPDVFSHDTTHAALLEVPLGVTNVTVTVRVSAPGRGSRTNSYVYPVLPPPPNDGFDQRITISSLDEPATGYNYGATKETGEPAHADNAGGRSVWWIWTAPVDSVVKVKTSGSDFDTLLGVYRGTAVSNLVLVASNNDAAGLGLNSKVFFNAIAGTEYHIAVDGFDNGAGPAAGRIRLTVTVLSNAPPKLVLLPVGVSTIEGRAVRFEAAAVGDLPLEYQWRWNGSSLAGETNAVLTIPSVTSQQGGAYSVQVSNRWGVVTSPDAILAFSSRITWTGLVSSDWNNASNWNPQLVPNEHVTAVIASGHVLVSPQARFATLEWEGGSLSGVLIVSSNALLKIGGSANKGLSGIITNAGTIHWTGSGCLAFLAPSQPHVARWVNLPGALIHIQTDAPLLNCGGAGHKEVLNQGLLRKSVAIGRTLCDVPFTNVGTLEIQEGILSLAGAYQLAGGTLRLGVRDLTRYGGFTVPGPATLAGCLGVTLLDGFVPSLDATFPVVTFVSSTGAFNDCGGLDAGFGRKFEPVYSGSSVYLALRSVPVEPPSITAQPSNSKGTLGSEMTLSVRASGTLPLHYQWRLNEVCLPGATNAALHVPQVRWADAGSYSVVVSNPAGAVTSTRAVLTVDGCPVAPGSMQCREVEVPRFVLTGEPGSRFEVQASTNLRDWRPLATVTLADREQVFADPTGGLPCRFYRALPRP
jgi:subtilisin family serine protease